VKRVPLSLLVALTILSVGAFPVPAAVVTNERSPLAFSLTDPCTGEEIAFSGEQHIFFMEGNPDFGFHINFHLEGIGANGTQYEQVGHNQTVTVFNQPPQQTGTSVQGIRILSSGPADNFVFGGTFHTTINANGEQTVVVNDVTTDCMG
jgi:hypothetical protein